MKSFVHRTSMNVFFCPMFLTIQEGRNLAEKQEHLSAGDVVIISLLIYLFVFRRCSEIKHSNFPYVPSGHIHSSCRRGEFEMPTVQKDSEVEDLS